MDKNQLSNVFVQVKEKNAHIKTLSLTGYFVACSMKVVLDNGKIMKSSNDKNQRHC